MKRILTLFAAAVLLCGCAQDTPDGSEHEAAMQFTEDMPEQLTREDLRKRAVQYAEVVDGCPEDLYGDFADFEIRDADDAFRAVASVADILGIQNFKEEIRFYGSSESPSLVVYYFSQYYQDVPLVGRRTVLHVDPETRRAEALMSGYIPDIVLNTEPKISAEEAIAVTQEAYQVNVPCDPELIIRSESSQLRLAWYLETDSDAPYEVWVDAQSGQIIYAEYPADYFGGA